MIFCLFACFAGELQTLGNHEGHHLTLLGDTKDSFLIGGKDGLYNLSRVDLTQQSVRMLRTMFYCKIIWHGPYKNM